MNENLLEYKSCQAVIQLGNLSLAKLTYSVTPNGVNNFFFFCGKTERSLEFLCFYQGVNWLDNNIFNLGEGVVLLSGSVTDKAVPLSLQIVREKKKK